MPTVQNSLDPRKEGNQNGLRTPYSYQTPHEPSVPNEWSSGRCRNAGSQGSYIVCWAVRCVGPIGNIPTFWNREKKCPGQPYTHSRPMAQCLSFKDQFRSTMGVSGLSVALLPTCLASADRHLNGLNARTARGGSQTRRGTCWPPAR